MAESVRAVPRRAAPRHAERGFTLLEVLVAFAILAVSLGGLLMAFSDGLRTTDRSITISTATLQAQSLMDEVGRAIPVRQGEVTGVLEDGTRWQVSVEPFETGEGGTAAVVRSLFVYRVDVTVEWDAGRSVTLTSLRLTPDDA